MAVFDRVNALKVEMSREKRRFWCFNNEREWLTIAVPVCAFKRVFQNFCLLGKGNIQVKEKKKKYMIYISCM